MNQAVDSAVLLLSLLRFTSNEAADRVLGILTRHLEQHSFLDTTLISKFLVRQHDSFHIAFSSDSLEKLLHVCLATISKYPIEGTDFLSVLVENICSILQKQNGVLSLFQSVESMYNVVNDATLEIRTRYLLAKNVLVPIHPIIEINQQQRNSSLVRSILSELSDLPEQSSEFLRLFYAAVWGKAIELETSQIQALIAIVKQALARIESIEDVDDKQEQRKRVSGYAV